jgi:hypothetical protein
VRFIDLCLLRRVFASARQPSPQMAEVKWLAET